MRATRGRIFAATTALIVLGFASMVAATLSILATGREGELTRSVLIFAQTLTVLAPLLWGLNRRRAASTPAMPYPAERAWWFAVGTSVVGIGLAITTAALMGSAPWTPVLWAAVAAALLLATRAVVRWSLAETAEI